MSATASTPSPSPAPSPKPAASAKPPKRTSAADSSRNWPLLDRFFLLCCWVAGLLTCLIAFAIVAYMAWKGAEFLRPKLFVESPNGDVDQSHSGGFLDPLIGTLLLTLLGTALAVPISIAVAVWLSEYGRPFGLAVRWSRTGSSPTEMNWCGPGCD